MQIRITSATTQAEISAQLAEAVKLGATHCRVLKDGGQRATVIKIDDLIGTYHGDDANVTFGKREPGLPFEDLNGEPAKTVVAKDGVSTPDEVIAQAGASDAPASVTAETTPTPAPDATPAKGNPFTDEAPISAENNPTPEPDPVAKRIEQDIEPKKRTGGAAARAIRAIKGDATAPKAKRDKKETTVKTKQVGPKPAILRGSGFIAYVDELLHDIKDKAPVEGFVRSRHTVTDALKLVLRKFAGKDPVSVKKIIKVRPRHLEKAKYEGAYDGEKNRAPRWAYVGPGHGSGFIARIDELVLAGGKSNADIAQIVAKEFGRTYESTLVIVQQRPSKIAKKTGDQSVMRRGPAPKPGHTKRDQLIAKNKALLAAKKSKAKKSKAA